MMELNQDFREFIELLNSNEVEYLVVGGYAVGFHGSPRFTGDIDFWLAISRTNASKIMKVLSDFGFTSLDITEDDFLNQDLIIQLGYEPVRIDLLTSVTGLNFQDCFPRRMEADFSGLKVNFIHLNDLKINKSLTGRNKDLGDLDSLK